MTKNYAVIQGNTVSNIIVADTKEIAEQVTGLTCIEYTAENPASIGSIWNGTTFEPPVIEAIEVVEHITD
jgi:hypothetical protein